MIMEDQNKKLHEALVRLSAPLREEIIEHSKFENIPAGTEILREGQYIKLIPIVITGLIKVYKRHEDKELLLYYIQPEQSCVMSFSSSMENGPSQVFAKTEEDSEVLLISSDKLSVWRNQFPEVNTLFFQQFTIRYAELLETISQVIFDKLDKRLLSYLKERSTVLKTKELKITHRQIAAELGSSREVISRTIKKLESENLVQQLPSGIKIL